MEINMLFWLRMHQTWTVASFLVFVWNCLTDVSASGYDADSIIGLQEFLLHPLATPPEANYLILPILSLLIC